MQPYYSPVVYRTANPFQPGYVGGWVVGLLMGMSAIALTYGYNVAGTAKALQTTKGRKQIAMFGAGVAVAGAALATVKYLRG